jgi:hypothetical protein
VKVLPNTKSKLKFPSLDFMRFKVSLPIPAAEASRGI